MNALWDLWARIEGKPIWKLIADMEPETLLSTVDFRYLSDALTKEEALDMLRKMQKGKAEREKHLLEQGFPAYITSVGWSGYDEKKIRKVVLLCTGAACLYNSASQGESQPLPATKNYPIYPELASLSLVKIQHSRDMVEIKEDSVADYQFPDGNRWRQLFVEGKFTRPEDS